MSGLDTLIGKSLEYKIKENLGDPIFQKIQKKMVEQHDTPSIPAIDDFQKLDNALKEFFGNDAEEIEKQLINKIVAFKESKPKERKWITMEDVYLTKLILESLGDNDKKNILNAVIDEARPILDILNKSKIPQSSGYRKINALIQNGMLIPHGVVATLDGKRVTKYKSIFENISIEMEKNKVIVRAIPTRESLKKSMIMQLVYS